MDVIKETGDEKAKRKRNKCKIEPLILIKKEKNIKGIVNIC